MDSTEDTNRHRIRVRSLLCLMAGMLDARGEAHDLSKLGPEEKPVFDEFIPRLAGSTYGSEEYKGFLAAMRPALDHHYAKNSHHPEHFEDGVTGMSLFDLFEMLADWKAAGERHDGGGDIMRSLEVNAKRFSIAPQLRAILENTVREMGWKEGP